jgi:NADH-quinone oxidoreductase subunit A
MTTLLGYTLLFAFVGFIFILLHLLLGKLVRPARPEPEKMSIYECGEPTVGSAWIQFDLRFYVVALLFVIFDVEMVFFFPWAVVFGKLNALANPATQELSRPAEYQTLVSSLVPGAPPGTVIEPSVANTMAWVVFVDLLIFFAVLMMGFAYLWKRGDLDWVRSTASGELKAQPPIPPAPQRGRSDAAASPAEQGTPALAHLTAES